jgi:SAM-dependent methyltransferase
VHRRASPQLSDVPENYFGEEVAAAYDETAEHDPMFAPEAINPVVDFLVELAGDGRALELGIGTGRIALPLAERGVRVDGIDLSEAMVARLRAKPGGDRIDVTIGDFATTKVDGPFTLVYLVYNTIQNLTTQDAQVACFQNIAEHLEPGGTFVIEVGLPDLQRLPFGETIRPFHLGETHLGFDTYDVANQGLVSHHYTRSADGTFRYSWGPFRYVWPSELDLMARLAGMTLRERWSGWKREPFTNRSEKLVGVWEKPGV